MRSSEYVAIGFCLGMAVCAAFVAAIVNHPQAHAAPRDDDPLGDCIADCRKRGARDAVFTGNNAFSRDSGGWTQSCACVFGLADEKGSR